MPGNTPSARRQQQRVRALVWIGFAVAVLLLAWATLQAYRQTRTAIAGSDWVDHTLQVLNRTLLFETSLLTMESDHRAYLVRGDEAFAVARDRHGVAAAAVLAELRALIDDNPAQLGRLRDIERHLQARIAWMGDTTRLIESAGIDAGRDNFRPQGQGSIVPLQQMVADMRIAEERLLEERSRAAADAAAQLRLTLLYGPGVGLLVIFAGYFALNRQLRRIDAIRRDLVAVNAQQTAMLDGGGHMIIACAPDGRITLFNRAASESLGYAADAMVGRATPAAFHDPEEVAERARQLSRELGEPIAPNFEVFTALPTRGMREDRHWTYVRSNGERFPVQLVITAMHGENDELLGYIGIGQDISARVAAERDIQALNQTLLVRQQQLEESVRDLESFSYSVSHDLRAPLRHIDGYARMLVEDAADTLPGDCRRYLDEISASSRRMGRLIDDLLTLSRLGRAAMRVAPVDMNALVRDAMLDLDWSGQPKTVVQIANLPPCVGDSALLRQVWVNLLSNAVKYSKPRGVSAQVQVEGSKNDGAVRYRVADNGVGFDMRYADKLFGVFQRLHTQDEFEGTGDGLAIVRRVIARHGGEVHATSRVGEGAEFSFDLPLEPVA